MTQVCELCNGEASVYCCSDSAFLCWNCDSKVHGANFLAARHVRRTICSNAAPYSGAGDHFLPSFCRSCSAPESNLIDNTDAFSSSSACISTTDDVSSVKNIGAIARCNIQIQSKSRVNISLSSGNQVSSKYSGLLPSSVDGWKEKGVLVNWCKELGVMNSSNVIEMASNAFDRLRVLPYRVGLAASLWFSLIISRRFSAETTTTWQGLNKLEEASGVPAKLIVAAERMLRVKKQRRHQVEEGWAEC